MRTEIYQVAGTLKFPDAYRIRFNLVGDVWVYNTSTIKQELAVKVAKYLEKQEALTPQLRLKFARSRIDIFWKGKQL